MVLLTPFWKMYKGIVLNTTDPLLFDSKQEVILQSHRGHQNTIKFLTQNMYPIT
jgi:hypothetical protein